MTNLTAVPGNDPIPRIETTTPLLGGPGGPLNGQAQALLNRIEYEAKQRYSAWALMTPAQIADVSSFTGSIDVTLALEAIRTAVMIMGGGTIDVPAGKYKLDGVAGADGVKNGFLFPFTNPNNVSPRVVLRGAGRGNTIFQCGSNNMILVRLSDSHCALRDITLDANGKTGCSGFEIAPETVNNVANTYQLYNTVENVYVNGFAEGHVLKTGKTIAGSDSGCWYNRIVNVDFFSCLRGGYIPNQGGLYLGGSGRNTWSRIRIGQNCNTGIQNEGGGTQKFHDVAFEGIALGTTPNATPTAFINTQDSCMLSDIFIEACTRDIVNSGIYCQWNGGAYTEAKCVFTQPFRTTIGSSLSTLGFGGFGVYLPLAPLHVLTANGGDFRVLNAAGGSTYLQAMGPSAATFTLDVANASAQYILKLNSLEKHRFNAAGFAKFSNNGTYLNQTASYHEFYGDQIIGPMVVRNANASPNGSSGVIDAGFISTVSQGNLFYGSNGGTQTFRVAYNGLVFVQGVQVLGTRDTGWGNNTGATSKAGFDPSTVTLAQLAAVVSAMQTAAKNHGLIGT